jgi:hypothetical protein
VPYIREDQAHITVSVGVKGALKAYGDAWAEVEGANLESDDSKTRPGGQGEEVAVGGPSSRDDVTVRVQFSDIVATWHKELENAVINDEPIEVTYQFLVRRQAIGTKHTVKGIIKSARLPDFSSSGNEVGMYTIVGSMNERAA